jgi:hypothetical protein
MVIWVISVFVCIMILLLRLSSRFVLVSEGKEITKL